MQIILDGDQIIYNPEILAPDFERSGYNSVWTDGETDEWLQTVEDGIVTSCSRTGGKYSFFAWGSMMFTCGLGSGHSVHIQFSEWDSVCN